jgi:hypothetical protein
MQTQPEITFLIANLANLAVGITISKRKCTKLFSLVRCYAQFMQKSALRKRHYAEFVLTVSCTMGLEWVRMHAAAGQVRGIIF